MKLQTSTRLAIFAVLELAADADRQVSVAAIGEKYGVSSHHLAKVMNELARAGFVRAVRGAGGGYKFVGNARRSTLLDVIQCFEDLTSVDASGGRIESTPEIRAFADVLREVDDIARATFGSITIATMQKLVERHRAPREPRRGALRSVVHA
jgi:Rrf2 family protein